MPEVSIVIRTLNEERHLPALLDGIEKQTLKDAEVVVVDSGSKDRTRAIAAERADQVVDIASSEFTFGRSLNLGMAASSGAYAVVVSAHTRPAHDSWLENLVSPLRRRPEFAMVYGRQIGWEKSKFGEALDFDRFFGPEPRELDEHFFANNANSALRRELWATRPFDEALPGLEDIEWARYWRKQGKRIGYAHDAPIHHIHDESWPQVRRRYYREGQAARWIGWLKRRDLPREVWGEFRWLCGDLREASRRGVLGDRLGEILRFRFNKVAGTVQGVWNAAANERP